MTRIPSNKRSKEKKCRRQSSSDSSSPESASSSLSLSSSSVSPDEQQSSKHSPQKKRKIEKVLSSTVSSSQQVKREKMEYRRKVHDMREYSRSDKTKHRSHHHHHHHCHRKRRERSESHRRNHKHSTENYQEAQSRPVETERKRHDEPPSHSSRHHKEEESRNKEEKKEERSRPLKPEYVVERPKQYRRENKDEESDDKFEWGKKIDNIKQEKGDKQKPNFTLSGKLAEDTNTFNGVVIKYSEPPEARKPKRRWRLYPFKGDKGLPTLYIHRQSCYLIGRDRKIADIPVDHPSCSKQHAALQYRLVPFERDNGTVGKRVRPYLIDLESANGTYLNNVKVEPKRYVEIKERDVIKFGYSSREYVLLHEQSKDETQDDDVTIEPNENENDNDND